MGLLPTSEAAVLHKCDLHWGKETPSYNVDISKEVLDRVYKKVERILEIERKGHVIDQMYIVNAGDMVDGHNIFKTHPYHTDKRASYGRAQVNGLREAYVPHIERAATLDFETVEVVIVPGNHSRSGLFVHESDNYELILGDELKLEFKNHPTINIHTLDDKPARIIIKGLPFLVYHGQTIRMYMKVPWYGIMQRVKEWAFNYDWFYGVMLGHFHMLGDMSEAGRTVLLGGSPVTDDDFSREFLGREATPMWWFYGVHPTRGITWSYRLNLYDDDIRPKILRG